MLTPTKAVRQDAFPDCCLTCKHFNIDVGNVMGCDHPQVRRAGADFAHWCEDHCRNDQYVAAAVSDNQESSEEEWCLRFCERAGIAVSSALGSEAALQVERRFPTRNWKEAVAAGSSQTYRQWVLAQAEGSGKVAQGV